MILGSKIPDQTFNEQFEMQMGINVNERTLKEESKAEESKQWAQKNAKVSFTIIYFFQTLDELLFWANESKNYFTKKIINKNKFNKE